MAVVIRLPTQVKGSVHSCVMFPVGRGALVPAHWFGSVPHVPRGSEKMEHRGTTLPLVDVTYDESMTAVELR